MKKALVFLLILAVAGGLFAQDITFSGQVWSGLGLLINDMDDSDPMFGVYSVRENFAARGQLRTDYLNEQGNAGAWFILRGQADADGEGGAAVAVPAAEAFYYGFDGMVKLVGGILDSGMGTPGGIDTSFDNGGGTGAYVNIEPMSGLDLRFGTGADNLFAGSRMIDARYNATARFEVPNLLSIIGLFMNKEEDNTNFALGANLLLLEPLGFSRLGVDAAFEDLQNDDGMTVKIGQRIEYGLGPLGIEFRALQQLLMGDLADGDDYAPDLTFYGHIQYQVGNWIPRLAAGFNIGTGLRSPEVVVGGDNQYRANWDGFAKGGFTDGASNFYISPNVEFRFNNDDKTALQFGYILQLDLSDGAEAGPNRRTMNNVIYLDYRLEF